jgi:hypothetical protein
MPNTTTLNEVQRSTLDGTEWLRLALAGTINNKAQLGTQTWVFGGIVVSEVSPGIARAGFSGTPAFQVQGSTIGPSGFGFFRWNNAVLGPTIQTLHSRGATIGTVGALVSGDAIGRWGGAGDDGTGAFILGAEIAFAVDGAVSAGVMPGRISLLTASTVASDTEALRIDSAQAVWAFSPTGGLGYGPASNGTGSTVTQATNKSTAVTLNFVTGQITMNSAALAASTTVTFQLNNTALQADDIILCQVVSGEATAGSYQVWADKVVAATSAQVNVRNITGGSLSEAVVIQYAIIRGQNN